MEHLYAKFGDPNCIVFATSCGNAERQMAMNTIPTRSPSALLMVFASFWCYSLSFAINMLAVFLLALLHITVAGVCRRL